MVAVYSLFYRHWCMGNNHFSGTANCQNKKTGCYRIVETILTKSMDNSILSLLEKYDIPTPRYTSYPTVPYWDFLTINESKWKQSVIDTFNSENGELCIYIHLPFCENLCTFCACNKRITKNHSVEDPYIRSVLKEWQMYRALLPASPIIKEIHLGGGTPTFFSPDNLVHLINEITANAIVSDNYEFSIEVHPNYTTEEHLKKLSEIGFNRVSIGVQDFDPKIQFVINRIQSFEKTREVFEWARKYNYSSINIDLIYGLPHQTVNSVDRDDVPQIGGLIEVTPVNLFGADRGHAAANVARQAEDFLYGNEFHPLVSAGRGQSFQIELRIGRDACHEDTGAIAAHHQGLEHLLGRHADFFRHAGRAQVSLVHGVFPQFVVNARGIQNARGVGLDGRFLPGHQLHCRAAFQAAMPPFPGAFFPHPPLLMRTADPRMRRQMHRRGLDHGGHVLALAQRQLGGGLRRDQCHQRKTAIEFHARHGAFRNHRAHASRQPVAGARYLIHLARDGDVFGADAGEDGPGLAGIHALNPRAAHLAVHL